MVIRCMLVSVMFCVCAPKVLGQGRTWMIEAGSAAADTPSTGPTTVSLVPGQCTTISVWVEDPGGRSGVLNLYQLIIDWAATGGDGGTVSYLDNEPGQPDGDSVVLDQNDPDWVFGNTLFDVAAIYNETPGKRFWCDLRHSTRHRPDAESGG